MPKNVTKLKAYWDKESDDLSVEFPLGWNTNKDGSYLLKTFSKEFLEELKARGYDLKTLKFEVSLAS